MTTLVFATIIGAALNRYAGMESGNRYTPALVAAVAIGTQNIWMGLGWGLSLLAWRSVGWHKSIDMGRNEHTLLRDLGALGLISSVPFMPFAFLIGAPLLPVWTALAVCASYLFAMRALPWTPEWRHIAVAECLAGAALGALAWATI